MLTIGEAARLSHAGVGSDFVTNVEVPSVHMQSVWNKWQNKEKWTYKTRNQKSD